MAMDQLVELRLGTIRMKYEALALAACWFQPFPFKAPYRVAGLLIGKWEGARAEVYQIYLLFNFHGSHYHTLELI